VDVGSWQGLTRDELEQRVPDQFRRWLAFEEGWEDGETYEAMGQRVVGALLELAAQHDGERVLVITHGGPIRAASAFAAGISHAEARRSGPVVGNCFVAKFAAEPGRLRQVD
jgi:alpha-ribazole phosphatase